MIKFLRWALLLCCMGPMALGASAANSLAAAGSDLSFGLSADGKVDMWASNPIGALRPGAILMVNTVNVSNAAGLRSALLTAATNGQDDVIVLAAGTYATGGTPFYFVTNETNTLTLMGANGSTRDQVVLDGGGTSKVLKFDCVGSCGAITLQGVTVQNGNATGNDFGGGVSTYQSLILSDVSFTGNQAAMSGGAIYGPAWNVTVTNSIFSNNTAGGSGGAIYGSGTITSSLFSNNTASYDGGAILASSNSIIANDTFSGNSAVRSGAAIYMPASSSIINAVFYGHITPAIYAGSAYNLYNNLIDTGTGIAGSIPVMVGNVAPGTTSPFVDAASGNFRLAAGSRAIDAGLDPSSTTFANLVGSGVAAIRLALLTDLDGNPRPTRGTAVDVGAYESNLVPICTLTATPTSIIGAGTSTLTVKCSPAATSYIWTGGSCAGTSGTSCTVSPTVTTAYSVTGSSTGGTGNTASATVAVMPFTLVDCMFNWVEITYPNLFAPAHAASITLAPWHYRYYWRTDAYLGTYSIDNHVYYLGPRSKYGLFDVGSLTTWLAIAGCQ